MPAPICPAPTTSTRSSSIGGGAYSPRGQVRPAMAADADAFARVQERGWQQAYRHVFPPERLDAGGFIHVDRWRTRLETPPHGWSTFVAVDGSIVGFAS